MSKQRHIGTPQSSQMIWMEQRIKELEEHIHILQTKLNRINNAAACGTTDAWMYLSDDDKRKWFAQTLHNDTVKSRLIRDIFHQLHDYFEEKEDDVRY